MDVVFNRTQMQFTADFANAKRIDATIKDYQEVTVYKDVEQYTGSYEVTPKVEAQTMPTAQKLMAQDVTIKAIPYYEVSNDSGGSTVYIAKEL